MSDIAIKTAGLSKRYRIGAEAHLLKDMRDTVSDIVSSPTHFLRERVRRLRSSDDLLLWALRDIEMEVKRGEIVGVIGRNGAGKSTLLKILSRITEPTDGYADIFGRVGSLLEVGTGFHYDLTGRENVYLNGAMLGMKRWEIARQFDEIVAFSGVERFLDTPVKHYSSGMFLRLAFSVAAHLDTEILLVDEILAVGDLEFQKKCLSKMDDVATQGRTVLFVSHNLAVMKQLCETCLVLDNGCVDFRGPVVEGIARYSKLLTEGAAAGEVAGQGWWGVKIGSRIGGLGAHVAIDEPLAAEAWLELEQDVAKYWVYCIVEDSAGETIVHSRIGEKELGGGPLCAGRYRVRVNAPALYFAPGLYSLHLKFLGHNAMGADVRHTSERILLDVTGNVEGIASARLAPPIGWSVEPAVLASEREACAD